MTAIETQQDIGLVAKIIADFGSSEKDTGSVEVQVALLTYDINDLTIHLKKNPKDFQTRMGLIRKVNRRKRLLKFLKAKDFNRYNALMHKLGLNKGN